VVGAGAGCSKPRRGSPSPPSGFGAPPCATSHRSVCSIRFMNAISDPISGSCSTLTYPTKKPPRSSKSFTTFAEGHKYPFSPRIRTLRAILAKLRPEPVVREPLPPPKMYGPPKATPARRRRASR
jgi:hypothetical protein